MANRIVGNTYIIDTQSANTALPLAGGGRMKILSAHFWGSDTTAQIVLSYTTTSDTFARLAVSEIGTNGGTDKITFGGEFTINSLKVPVLTAGTAWLTLG